MCTKGFVMPEVAKALRSKLYCVKNLVKEVEDRGIGS